MSDLGDFTSGFDDDGDAPASGASGGADGREAEGETETDAAGTGPGARSDATGDGTSPFESLDVDPAGRDRGIGVVSVSQGLRVAEDGDDTSLRAFVTTGNREGIRLGTYLLVPYPDDELLFCRITALEYAQEFQSDDATEINARRMMRRDGFTERDYKFVASLDPAPWSRRRPTATRSRPGSRSPPTASSSGTSRSAASGSGPPPTPRRSTTG